jgi:hypothetical protein
LEELRLVYGWALRDAGHAVTYADTYLNTGEQGEDFQLAFGAHAVAPPRGLVVMNSEHHDHHFTLGYRETLEDAALVVNMGSFSIPHECALAQSGPDAIVECPPGILSIDRVVEHSPLWVAERRFDVLHYGSVTPRRARIFEALAQAGITVTCLYGVLGEERDWYIDRAKVVLDLKQEGDEPDDQTRAWWALSRGACVLSENAQLTSGCRIGNGTERPSVADSVKAALASAELRSELRDEYARAIGRCDVSPMLKALGL